ncbi:MAG: ABC transporter ATP-binding protein [Acidimicrobiales bacterium]
MLSIDGLVVRYGDLEALHGITCQFRDGDFVALLGRNGAGKSSLVRTVTGLTKAASGSIHYGGHRLDRLSPRDIVRHGIAAVPEGRQLFESLRVEDNLRLGAFGAAPRRIGACVRGTDADIEARLDEVFELLPELRPLARRMAGSLSGGEQQMVAVGRALMARPQLLLVDELSLGLAPMVVARLVEHLHALHARGITVVLVEQNINIALRAAQYAYVLESGDIRHEGNAAELLDSSAALEAYLDVHL